MLDQEQIWLQAEIEELRLSAQYAVGRAAATGLGCCDRVPEMRVRERDEPSL